MKPEILNEKLTCAEEIAKKINEQQKETNNYRIEINNHIRKTDKLKPHLSITKAFVFTPEMTNLHHYRKIKNLKFYYNFYNQNEQIFSSVLSGKNLAVEVKFKDSFKIIETEIDSESLTENKIETLKSSLKNLKKKLSHIRGLTRVQQKFMTNSQESNDMSENSYYDHEENSKTLCKISCCDCVVSCSFRLSELNNKNDLLTKEQIQQELKRHKHPQSRIDKITRKNRTLEEGKKELYFHYIYNHKNNN